jgi:2-polyprenyl-3-methyl-5-hydroxy-6-metoxy-1,4-benzoquinol methylase
MQELTPPTTDQEKIRQQFNYGPYPRIPPDVSPREDYNELFQHSLVTAYYLRHRRVIDPANKVILDAGCGSGYKALVLAMANPGAKIVGIDLSEQSVALARERLKLHSIENVEFHVLKIEDLPQMGLQFDYINCDEVLYILPDPIAGLQAMKAVLKPEGLIRANLHHAYQRHNFYQAQTLFKMMGLMDDSPAEFEEEVVLETMQALKDGVKLKNRTWVGILTADSRPEIVKESLAMNYLFVGDTGFTIPDLFNMLEQADLEFVRMVNWRHWDVVELFQEPDNLPAFWSMSLAGATEPEKLRIFELLHPVHRLMDFWCTHPGEDSVLVDQWSAADWQQAVVHLHPQLRTPAFKEKLLNCIRQSQPFEISQPVPLPTMTPVYLESSVAACLLPLWEGPQPIQALVDRYRQIKPLNPVTLAPLTEAAAFATVQDLLNRLDAFLYVLLETA